MSAKALFTPGSGDYFTPVDDLIALLPRGKKTAGLLVWNAIVENIKLGKAELKPGETEPKVEVKVTDWILSKSSWLRGYSLRFIQKGLQALSPFDPDTNPDGIGLIDRKRRNGRRTIIVLARLRGGSGKKRPQKPVDARTIPIPNDRRSVAASPAQVASSAAAVKKAQETPTGPVTPEEEALVASIFGKNVIEKATATDPLPPTSGP